MNRPVARRWLCPSILAVLATLSGCQPNLRADAVPVAEARPHNVIVMINDGAGCGTWDAAAYWQYGSREGAPYADFPQRLAVTTFPLNASSQPTRDSAQTLGYDAARAWDDTPVPAPDLPFAGYQYLAAVATDSAAAGTALSSGIKTYNNAINFNNDGNAVEFNTLRAKRLGMATGVVTSVPFAHATPAAFAAQNASRNSYHAIAHQMLAQGHMDLVMGTGGPGYSVDGRACEEGAGAAKAEGCANPWEWVAQQDWQQLEAGSTIAGNPAGPWRLIRSKEEFAALAQGRLPADRPLIGVPRVANTLQQARQLQVLGKDATTPSGVRKIDSVPDLATMTRGALRFLQQRSSKGLFLMVEGGRIDHALHETTARKALQDTAAFDDAIKAAIDKLNVIDPGLKNTLIVVTADHDHTLHLNGYAARTGKTEAGKPGVLGLVKNYVDGKASTDVDGNPYTILGFGNGPKRLATRGPIDAASLESPDYLQEAVVPLASETHGGGDVFLGAQGMGADTFSGVIDNTTVFTLIKKSIGLQ